jgi:hypothetical protein
LMILRVRLLFSRIDVSTFILWEDPMGITRF